MRTTLDLPEDLIKEAMKITGAKTKSALIKEALEDQIKRLKRKSENIKFSTYNKASIK